MSADRLNEISGTVAEVLEGGRVDFDHQYWAKPLYGSLRSLKYRHLRPFDIDFDQVNSRQMFPIAESIKRRHLNLHSACVIQVIATLVALVRDIHPNSPFKF